MGTYREINVTRCVDNVLSKWTKIELVLDRSPYHNHNESSSQTYNMGIFPSTKRGGRLNGNSFFAFQIHGIHLGSDTILSSYVMNGVDPTRVKQDAFRERRFATAAVLAR
eukprot:scaffold40823_cov191-Amphora_coffeaeformis.AAC.3